MQLEKTRTSISFLKYATDKQGNCEIESCQFHHHYDSFYATLFEPLQNKANTVLEIGIFTGESLRALRDFFPNAQIIGLDIEKQYMIKNENRIHTMQGNQFDHDDLTLLASQWAPFDIIIDDGSHILLDQMRTFISLYHYLKRNGYYIIEDVIPSSLHVLSRLPNAKTHHFDQPGRRTDDTIICIQKN